MRGEVVYATYQAITYARQVIGPASTNQHSVKFGDAKTATRYTGSYPGLIIHLDLSYVSFGRVGLFGTHYIYAHN